MASELDMHLDRKDVSPHTSIPVTTDKQKENVWSRGGAFFGLLLLAAVILIVSNLSEGRRFVDLVSRAEPLWLLAAFAYQISTYLCAGGVWKVVLKTCGISIQLRSLIPLALAKLFVDQVIPTAGVGGSLLVVRGLVRRGAPDKTATATLLLDLLSFYAAHAIAVGIAILVLWAHQELHPAVLALATLFSGVAVTIPISILWLTRPGKHKMPGWMHRVPIVTHALDRIADVPAEIIRNKRLFWQAGALQLAIFLLDAATLDAMLRAIGHPTRPDAVFAAFSMAIVAATVSLIPGGIGAFEGSSVLMLRFLNIPIEAGLAATLLLRAYTLWLPMAPGLLILRHENSRRYGSR